MTDPLLPAFERFHRDNPHVLTLYTQFALRAKERNRSISISLLTERIRWETTVETVADDGFKINNNHRAFYARLLNEDPRLTGMFKTRVRCSEEA